VRRSIFCLIDICGAGRIRQSDESYGNCDRPFSGLSCRTSSPKWPPLSVSIARSANSRCAQSNGSHFVRQGFKVLIRNPRRHQTLTAFRCFEGFGFLNTINALAFVAWLAVRAQQHQGIAGFRVTLFLLATPARCV
jgi:hypothetical protein